jgi:type IV pilus assembly protein PilV
MLMADWGKHKQSGVGLVEVLMALLVLAIGVLGYAGLQLVALKGAEEASYRAHASLIAQDALERFLGNEGQIANYMDKDAWRDDYLVGGEEPEGWKDCVTVACTPNQMLQWDIKQLSWMAATFLPAGRILGTDCEHNGNIYCVVVSWEEEQDPAGYLNDDGVNLDEGSTCVVMEVLR